MEPSLRPNAWPDRAAHDPVETAAPPQATERDSLPRSRATGEFNVLCYTLLSLFVVVFAVWLVFKWTGYGERYAPHADGWYKGGTRSIEVTLVREDAQKLACASDVVIEGLRCAYNARQQPLAAGATDRSLVRPYSTVDQVIFLGAGLWSSPGMAGPLPAERFTAVCNYKMLGTVKSAGLRWMPNEPFAPVKDAVPVGLLTDCVIPQ